MKLHVGERLAGSGSARQPGGYVVTGVVVETPLYGLYAGKKIFYNFDFSNKRLRETDEAEWLDVYLRANRYPHLDDAGYVSRRRALARTEVRSILGGRASNLWPEPIDLLEVANTRDPFTFSQEQAAEKAETEQEPIVVFARPRALPLGEWQHTVLPLTSILSVLAELLEFLRQAQAEGLVLFGLGPGAVLVDGSDRVHYVGTDMVVESSKPGEGIGNSLDQIGPESMPAEAWGRLFPPERFPRGFTAPEYYRPGALPDPRGDLFAWGCLAYLLLTGQAPGQIAQEQAKPWPTFQEVHFTRLAKGLRDIPETHVRNWAEQLGVREQALTEGWPDNLVAVLRALLQADLQRRPGSVEELLTWIDVPPPAPPAAVLAIITGPAEARLHLDFSGSDPTLDMVIRRGVGVPPRTPAEGTLLEQGPARPVVADPEVPLTLLPVHYTVFLRRSDADGPTYSAPVSGELIETSPAGLVRMAEQEAAQSSQGELPPRLALVFGVLHPLNVARALVRSVVAPVRGWAIQRLGILLQSDPFLEEVEDLLWERLRDPLPGWRQEAARALFTRPRSDDEVLRMARAAGLGSLDESLEALALFRQVGLSEAQAQQVRESLEGERPAACLECGVQLARRERGDHLRGVHGYVEVTGRLLPRPLALDRLWDRVFIRGDAAAHEKILELCGPAESGAAIYAHTLEKELGRRADQFGNSLTDGAPQANLAGMEKYLLCLRPFPQAEPYLTELLRSEHAPVRALGREGWLPLLGAKLRGGKATGKSLRHELELVGPQLLEEKIALCRRLPEVGVDAGATGACLALLEAAKPTTCVECGADVLSGDLETHLRRAHGIFQFRNVRRSLAETRAALLEAACGPIPDEAAWRALAELASDRHGPEADRRLVGWLCHKLKTLRGKRRAAALNGLAEVLAGTGDGPRLIPWLVGRLKEPELEVLARELALEVGARLEAPVEPAVLAKLKPLLSVRDLPRDARRNAVMGLLRTTGQSGAAAFHLLEAYVAQTGKLRAIEKLHELEGRIGKMAALDLLCGRLEDQVRMNCPRCGLERQRLEMVRHLWDRHRLVLDGRRVREPWRVLEDWVVDYGLEKEPGLYQRCWELARKLDPDGGEMSLRRMLLRHGVEDPNALAELVAQARNKQRTLCPHCFAEVPIPELPRVLRLSLDDEGLEGGAFRVEVWERGFFPWLEIENPAGQLYHGREPDRGITRTGALVMFVGPVVVAAFLLIGTALSGAMGLVLALGLGLFLGGLVYLLWQGPAPGRDRLLDRAWTMLVPSVLESMTPDGIEFLGGLAWISRGGGDPDKRARELEFALEKLATRADLDLVELAALAALVGLAVEDSLARRDDPVPLVVEQVGRCQRGELPISYAVRILENVAADEAEPWIKGMPQRLEILVLARAFAAGLELGDLVDLGRTHPALAAALGLEDFDHLAQLRLLWELRANKPWEKAGGANTVFELAECGKEADKILARVPDLLLLPRRGHIAVGSRGTWFQDECLTEMPSRLEIVPRRLYNDAGFDLLVGRQRFRFAQDPKEPAEELERWLKFYFEDFVPLVSAMHKKPSGKAGQRVYARNALSCPACRRELLGRVGDVGIKIVG